MGYGETGSVENSAYSTAKVAEDIRQDTMNDIKAAIGNNNSSTNNDIASINVNIGGEKIDISTGPGALVLDDMLQKISTVQQSAAQMLAAKNRGVKEVSQLMR